jgi:Tol biopolymer transport system component
VQSHREPCSGHDVARDVLRTARRGRSARRHWAVAVSGDATHVAPGSTARRAGPATTGIYTVRSSDGGGLQRLTSDTYEDAPGDYSPDGKRLVYYRVGLTPPESEGWYVLKTNGTGTRKIAPCCSLDSWGGSWSPQGNDIVFSWSPPGFPPKVHSTIWVVHSDGSGLRQLPVPGCGGPIADPDAHGCADATWSPDGTKILFRLTTPGRGEGGDLYTVNADGTDLTRVTHDGDVEKADWGTRPLAHD